MWRAWQQRRISPTRTSNSRVVLCISSTTILRDLALQMLGAVSEYIGSPSFDETTPQEHGNDMHQVKHDVDVLKAMASLYGPKYYLMVFYTAIGPLPRGRNGCRNPTGKTTRTRRDERS